MSHRGDLLFVLLTALAPIITKGTPFPGFELAVKTIIVDADV
jgi:hypothetical protein